MMLLDVNVLIYAHREDAPGHRDYREWLESAIQTGQPVGIPEIVLSGFVRIVTHQRIFDPPSPLETALAFADRVRSVPTFLPVLPGPRHWSLFVDLCRASEARGKLVADAYLAAFAMELDAEWISADGDFARFSGLRWRHPLRSH